MDRPLTPSQKGDRAVQRFFEKINQDQIQAERDAVLTATARDIKAMEAMVADILKQDSYCVYGSEEKIQAAKERFGTLVKLTPEKADK